MNDKIAALALALSLLLAARGHGDPTPRPEFPGSPMMEMEV